MALMSSVSDQNINKKQFSFNWKTVLFVIIVGIALYVLIPKLIGVKEAVFLLRRLNPYWVSFAVVMEIISYVGMAILTQVVLNVIGERLRFADLVRLAFLNVFAIHVFPVGGVGTAATNYYFLKSAGISDGKTIITFVIKNIFIYISLGIIFILSLLYLPTHAQLSLNQLIVVVGLTAFAIWLLVYIILLYRDKDKFYKRARQVANFLNRIYKKIFKKDLATNERIDTIIEDMHTGLQYLDHQRSKNWYAFGGSLINWLGDILCLGLVFLALGYQIHLGVLAFAYCIANILSIISWIPGGLGVVEGSLGLIFISFGVPADLAWIAVLIYRLISFWLPIPAGMYSFFSLMRKVRTKEFKSENGNQLSVSK